MSNYINQPLDSRAQNLLKMVEYNGHFLTLYKPVFVIFSGCEKTGAGAILEQNNRPGAKLALSLEKVLTARIRSIVLWTDKHSYRHHSPATSTVWAPAI